MLKYLKMTVGEMGTNCYIVWDIGTKEALIIDPGGEGVEIAQEINYLQIDPKMILLTHGHSDHWKGVSEIQHIFKIPVAMSIKDKFLFKKNPEIDLDKEKVPHLEIIPTPGHTPGSVCFLAKNEKLIFSGDIISTDGEEYGENYGYTDLIKSKESRDDILSMDGDILILPGHGEEVFIGFLKS